jgi:hypothetical protein
MWKDAYNFMESLNSNVGEFRMNRKVVNYQHLPKYLKTFWIQKVNLCLIYQVHLFIFILKNMANYFIIILNRVFFS